FRVSEEAWQKGGSKMFVEVNKDVAIEDLIRGVVIQSGNDATIVLAEGLAGSENAFAAQLNSIAQNLGMANNHFANASGWPDDNHYSTARDLGTLASAIIKNFPDYYHYYAEKEFTYNGIRQMNRNPLLLQNIGADGVKTGHTESGGFGLIGSGIAKDGRRVIIVLNGLDSLKARAQESKKLLVWGMENFENKHVFDAGATITTAPVIYGQQKQIALAVQSPLDITIPKNSAEKVKIKTDYQSPIIAPVKKGDTIGTLTVSIPGQPDVTTPLIAAEDIEEQGIFGKTVSKLKHLISGA
ncbi:MAG: D-alanyl-D-alanine carboxypeptidase family protein, partial [Bdellovibrionales bacterium]